MSRDVTNLDGKIEQRLLDKAYEKLAVNEAGVRVPTSMGEQNVILMLVVYGCDLQDIRDVKRTADGHFVAWTSEEGLRSANTKSTYVPSFRPVEVLNCKVDQDKGAVEISIRVGELLRKGEEGKSETGKTYTFSFTASEDVGERIKGKIESAKNRIEREDVGEEESEVEEV